MNGNTMDIRAAERMQRGKAAAMLPDEIIERERAFLSEREEAALRAQAAAKAAAASVPSGRGGGGVLRAVIVTVFAAAAVGGAYYAYKRFAGAAVVPSK